VRAGPIDEATLIVRARALGAVLATHDRLAAGAGDPATGGSVDVLLLHGPMGAGKTTFTRALAIGLGVTHPERVSSPTFTLCMVHAAPGPRTLVHVDLFRLADADDDGMGGAAGFDALGGPGALDLEEITEDALQLIGDPGHRVLVVEWAAKWSTPPADHLTIRLHLADGGARRILGAEARGPRSTTILAAWSAAVEADSPSFIKG
jgi:tRNA A37 threonylcarbamoyladenosine biosynthesis protein TsaE